MISRLSHAGLWVLDQDEAVRFYTEKLGFEVRTDQTMDDFRWITVGPPDQPDLELILLVPGPPMMDAETAEQIKSLVAKGSMGSGVFATDDCRRTYEELRGRGVEFLQEPQERFYGIEATFRDNSGNWFSLTQRAEVPNPPEPSGRRAEGQPSR
jgi:catechol 2,3-dioxygenase-like lactoylglutathione lyase family enzyme